MNAFLSMLLIVDDVKKGLQRCIFSPLIPFFNHLFQLKKAIKGMKFLVQHGIVQKCTRMFSLSFLFRYHFVIQPSWNSVFPSAGSCSSLYLAFCQLAFHSFSLLSALHHLAFRTSSHLYSHPSLRLAFCIVSSLCTYPSIYLAFYIVRLICHQFFIRFFFRTPNFCHIPK